jgi:hypothetical protein
VCIRDDTATGWHNDIKGVRALAVAGSRAALFGGYGPDYGRLAVTELNEDHARPGGEHRIVWPARRVAALKAQRLGTHLPQQRRYRPVTDTGDPPRITWSPATSALGYPLGAARRVRVRRSDVIYGQTRQ